MDQTLALILHGCSLARQLEANLVHLAHDPESLSKSCDDVLTVFLTCKDRLLSSNHQPLFRQTTPPPAVTLAADQSGIQHWLRSAAMERLQAQVLEMAGSSISASMGMMEVVGPSVGGGDVRGVAAGTVAGSDSAAVRAVAMSSSGSQQRRRRRDETERRTIRVPVPQIGNTEVPPEDGFTWRKYGQKEILGSRFPRGYFRCTHQKLYQCPAKKQVQRLDNDPDTYQVTYRGQHTCHMSATAPSVAPPPPDDVAQLTAATTSALHQAISAAAAAQQQQQLITSSGSPSSVGRWALEFRLGGGGEAAGPSSRYGGGGGGGGRDHHQVEFPVTDMAAAMFSSGSSSTNSMDLIFNAAMDVLPPAIGDLDHDHDHDHHDDVKQLGDRGKGKLV